MDLSLPPSYRKKREEETKLHLFMRSVAESGMVYTVAALVVLVCQVAQAYSAVLIVTSLVSCLHPKIYGVRANASGFFRNW